MIKDSSVSALLSIGLMLLPISVPSAAGQASQPSSFMEAYGVGRLQDYRGEVEVPPEILTGKDKGAEMLRRVAWICDRPDIVRKLVEKGADANPTGLKQVLPALYEAVRANHLETTKYLIDLTKDLGLRFNEESLMGLAAETGNPKMVRLLLDHKVPAANAMAFCRDVRVARLLLDAGADVNALGYNDCTFAVIAAENLELMKLAVEHKANLNGSEYFTPLCYANLEVAKYMLDHGADVNGGTENVLFRHVTASEGEHLKLLRLFLEHGAKVNIHGTFGPLSLAAWSRNADAVKLLLEYKADPNAQDKDGLTPLHVAAQRGFDEIVRLLIANGADSSLKDKNGDTPLHAAAGGEDYPLSPAIINYYPHAWQVFEEHKKIVEMLLKAGADPDAKDGSGKTPREVALSFVKQDPPAATLPASRPIASSTSAPALPLMVLRKPIPHQEIADLLDKKAPGQAASSAPATQATRKAN